jgi:hypothetical protein
MMKYDVKNMTFINFLKMKRMSTNSKNSLMYLITVGYHYYLYSF